MYKMHVIFGIYKGLELLASDGSVMRSKVISFSAKFPEDSGPMLAYIYCEKKILLPEIKLKVSPTFIAKRYFCVS